MASNLAASTRYKRLTKHSNGKTYLRMNINLGKNHVMATRRPFRNVSGNPMSEMAIPIELLVQTKSLWQ